MLAENVTGPHWLKDDHIAELVVDALFYHDGSLYTLLPFVVMSNHVHVLLSPLEKKSDDPVEQVESVAKPASEGNTSHYVPLHKITQSLKGYTAREANRLLGRTGQTFWQDESYDHWVRLEIF
jgi:REP element-mobilizing transposase RayT